VNLISRLAPRRAAAAVLGILNNPGYSPMDLGGRGWARAR
jgi:hypothetical protein